MRTSLYLLALVAATSSFGKTNLCGHSDMMRAAFRAGKSPATLLNTPANPLLESLSDTDVQRYDLNIELSPSTGTIAGDNTITVKSNVANLTEFTFRLRSNFSISSVTLDGRTIPVVRLDTATVKALFDRPYSLNEVFALKVTYNGTPVSEGFGSVGYYTHAGSSAFSTLSETTHAHTWWPVKEDNNDKALVNNYVTVPSTWVVAANGVLQGTDALSGSRTRYRWSTNYPTSPYLVSIGATNYRTWTKNYTPALGGTMPGMFYIWPESDTTSNRAGWEKSLDMITTFRDYFGEYPFVNEKYGIYQFNFGGGMEHQTITGQSAFNEDLTSHELTHQWYGDMMTCATWNHIWCNEGFASYGEAIWVEKKPGSTGLPALKAYMTNDLKPVSPNGTVYVPDGSSESRIFSTSFTYNKGAWVLHMLRHVLGDTKFFAALADYRALHAYSTVTTEDVRFAAEGQYGSDLNWFFDEWVYQLGAPKYTYGASSTTVNGQTYLLLSLNQTQTGTNYPTFKMPIDLRYTAASTQTTKVIWNDAKNENFVIPVAGAPSGITLDPDSWILNDGVTSTSFTAGGPVIVNTSPKPGISGLSTVNQVTITFHTPVNASAANFTITEVGTGVSIPFTYSYNSSNNTVTLGGLKLQRGSYQVTVSDNVTAVNSGKKLDGEISGSNLPSGDGVAGGSSTYVFSLNSKLGGGRPPVAAGS